MLGPKPFAELPAYVSHFAVGIIPFVVNDLTRAVNPIKLREMLAAGCRVVSTHLPEVDMVASALSGPVLPGSGKAVHVASSEEEFVEAVRLCLAHPPTVQQKTAISLGVWNETWEMKVKEIVGSLTY